MGFVVGWTANGSSPLLMFGGRPCARSQSLLLLPLGLVCLCLVPRDSQIGFLWERTQITPVWTRGAARELSPHGSTSLLDFILLIHVIWSENSLCGEKTERKEEKIKKLSVDDDIWSNTRSCSYCFLKWHIGSFCQGRPKGPSVWSYAPLTVFLFVCSCTWMLTARVSFGASLRFLFHRGSANRDKHGDTCSPVYSWLSFLLSDQNKRAPTEAVTGKVCFHVRDSRQHSKERE